MHSNHRNAQGEALVAVSRAQRKALVTRNLIVAAASELLAAGGTAAVTLDAVSQRADVSVQTIYNRVGGRPALLIATCDKALAELDGYMNAAFESSGSVIERLHAVIDAYVRFAREKPAEFRILAEPPDDAGALAALETKTATEDNLVEALLREGVQDGSLDPTTNPELTSRVLWASMNGVLSLAWRPGNIPLKPEDLVLLVREASRLYCRSLLAGHLVDATNG